MTDEISSYIDDVISGSVKLSIPILDDDEIIIGSLIPITRKDLKDNELMRLLSEWRNTYKNNFLTRFNATIERTKEWLDNIVFPSRSQILFVVTDASGEKVGHTGFKNLSLSKVLLDNTIRGLRTEEPKIFVFANRHLIAWLFNFTGIEKVEGEVFADNISALMMNNQLGFKLVEKLILEEVSEGDRVIFKPSKNGSLKNTRILHRIEITRSDFNTMKKVKNDRSSETISK
jgi:hypothetical protein